MFNNKRLFLLPFPPYHHWDPIDAAMDEWKETSYVETHNEVYFSLPLQVLLPMVILMEFPTLPINIQHKTLNPSANKI